MRRWGSSCSSAAPVMRLRASSRAWPSNALQHARLAERIRRAQWRDGRLLVSGRGVVQPLPDPGPPVSASTSQLSGAFTDSGIDTDGDGLFNRLDRGVGLN